MMSSRSYFMSRACLPVVAPVLLLLALPAGADTPTAAEADPPKTPFEISPLEQLLRPADLSICREERDAVAPGEEVDVAEFASRLHGTWTLDARTIRGLPIDATATFLLDLEPPTETEDGEVEVKGAAVMIDYGNLGILDPLELTVACPKDATVAALWDVTISRTTPYRLALVMEGEYFGSYGDFRHGVYETERSSYTRLEGKYLSGRLVTPSGSKHLPDDNWDRVDLTEGSLVYVSCEGRYVERYYKISDEKPLLDGAALREAWEQRKQAGTLLVPIPVEPRFVPDPESSRQSFPDSPSER